MPYRTRQLRQAFHDLRTEAAGAGREAAAFGAGIFIGCSPFYGCHLLLVWVIGRALRLNRLKMYVAANISNPLFSPLLVLSELQIGAWTRRQTFHDLSLAAIRQMNPWMFAADLLLGSVIVGAVLGVLVAALTYATGVTDRDDALAPLWERASDLYLRFSITGWEFARSKLRRDPVYRAAVAGGHLRNGRVLLDVGCGQGLTLAAIASARALADEGRWPGGAPAPPRFDRMIGIERRPGVARLAQRALGSAADVRCGDARDWMCEGLDAVLFFDVLHLMPYADQDRVVHAAAAALGVGGTLLVREADASAGWRFMAIRAGNRITALVMGRWRQRFYFRTVDGWAALLIRDGFDVAVRPMNQGTPFANRLVIGVRSSGDRAALDEVPDVYERSGRMARGVELAAEPERARDG
jgi:uncharacterized protein (DUF2062 family)/SAM-dependent methyltransferase